MPTKKGLRGDLGKKFNIVEYKIIEIGNEMGKWNQKITKNYNSLQGEGV